MGQAVVALYAGTHGDRTQLVVRYHSLPKYSHHYLIQKNVIFRGTEDNTIESKDQSVSGVSPAESSTSPSEQRLQRHP